MPNLLCKGTMDCKSAAVRREVFVKLALEKGLDPLVAEHWYQIDVKEISSSKVCY